MRWVVAGLAVLVLLAACGGDDEDLGPSATVGPGPSTTEAAPPSTVDVTTVPDVIDVAYVQAVMDTLDGVLHDAAKEAAKDPSLGEGFQARLRALYTEDEFPVQLRDWEDSVERVAMNPARPTTRVKDIVSVSSECIFFSAERDYSPMLLDPLEDVVQPYYLMLMRDQLRSFNSTIWSLALDTFYRDGKAPADQCAV